MNVLRLLREAQAALVSFLAIPERKTSSSTFELPVFTEPKQIAPLPSREEIYDETFDRGPGGS